MRMSIFTAGLVLTFLATSAFAIIGPPTAGLNKGQWNAGANYLYSSQDLDTIKVKWTEVGEEDGTPYTDFGTYKLDIRDLNINRYYGQLGYGVSDSWEAYVQLGVADIKGDYREVGDDVWDGVNFDNNFFYGLGTKYTFAKKEKVDWGVALQMNMLSTDWSGNYTDVDGAYTETGKINIDIDAMEVLVAVGPTVDMGSWKLYGGALYSLLSVDHDYKCVGSWVGGTTGTFTCKDSGDTDTDSFGGYVGGQCNIYKNWNMAIEFLGTGDGWGAGAGIQIPF